jgi:predicted DNA-binding transcriptional regulator AlpA
MTAQPKPRDFVLPPSLAPRGLRREQAAAYVGVSPSMFDWMIVEGIMPKPKRVGARVIWDRHTLDEFFTAMPSDEDKPHRSVCDEIT